MLKDLVLKENSIEKELISLQVNYDVKLTKKIKLALDTNGDLFSIVMMSDLVSEYERKKAEILNKPVEYTREDWIKIFEQAGFQRDGNFMYINNINSHVNISETDLRFKINYNNVFFETCGFELNQIDDILFYYNIFRNILHHENDKLNVCNVGGGQ